nr:MAG TPA: hypothetical protein [Caudoviricetes sp.]
MTSTFWRTTRTTSCNIGPDGSRPLTTFLVLVVRGRFSCSVCVLAFGCAILVLSPHG